MTLNSIWSFLVLALVVYLLLGLYLFLSQSRLLYYPDLPSRAIVATPERVGLAYETVEIRTEDSVRLHGWYLPANGDTRGVLLFFHGNAGNISHRLDSLKIFSDLGLDVLIFDYRGYGRSEGEVSEQGTYLDAQAAWRYLTDGRRISEKNIVLFGRSLGAAIAAQLATRHNPSALIMESGFTSAPDLAAPYYPLFPVRLLARFRYSARDYLKSVRCPVLIVHSLDDEIVPIQHGRELFAAAHEPKEFLEIQGGHNDGFLVSRQSYVAGLDAFLTQYLSE
jgi:hypothetical protein